MLIEFRLKGTDGIWRITDKAFRNEAIYDYRPYTPLPPPEMDLSGSRGEAAAHAYASIERMRRRDEAAVNASVSTIPVKEPYVRATILNLVPMLLILAWLAFCFWMWVK